MSGDDEIVTIPRKDWEDELERNQVRGAALEEASSVLLSVKIQYEKRKDLTVVERELLQTIRDWLELHPVPTEAT